MSTNPFIRPATVASLSVASFVLMGACQGYEGAEDTEDTEELSTWEPSADDDAEDTEELSTPEASTDDGAEDVGTAEEALMPAALCEVRCCSGALYTDYTANRDVCVDYARSRCGYGKSKRIKYGGTYIFARDC